MTTIPGLGSPDLQAQCKAAGLYAREAFWQDTPANVARIYNGAGPDSFSLRIREILSIALDTFYLAFVIHDWDYDHADGTRHSFEDANRRMALNMDILLNRAFPLAYFWLWPERARHWLRMRAAARAVELFGWDAWLTE